MVSHGNSGPDQVDCAVGSRVAAAATKTTKFCGHVVGTRLWPRRPGPSKTASELVFYSGRDRRRSGDLTLFRRALYLLSYPTG